MAMTRDAVWWRGTWTRILAGVTALGWQGTVLDADHLLDRARRETGLDDFGDPEFMAPLRLLLREFEARANADLTGRQVFAQLLLGSLRNRLHIRRALREHPAIAQEAVVAPLFVVGLPRTGTTLLQGLLAAAGGLRTPLNWETALGPSPPALARERDIKRRVRAAREQVKSVYALAPPLAVAHELGAQLPEECNPLLMTSFRALFFTTLFRCPEYHDYLYQTRFAGGYAWHKPHLQVLAFGQPPRTWALKGPVHLAALPELLRHYPDARVVFTHRNPVEVLPSMGALTRSLHMLISPLRDDALLGRDLMRNLAMLEEAGFAARRAWPADAPPFIDIRYADLVRDPLSTLRDIVRHFGLPEAADTASRVGAYLQENRQHRQGKPTYSLADFDLREGEIRETFRRELDLAG